MDESQRSPAAARLANLSRPAGRLQAGNLPTLLPITQADAADMLNVSDRSLRAAKVVVAQVTPDLARKVERGKVSVSAAADVARQANPKHHGSYPLQLDFK